MPDKQIDEQIEWTFHPLADIFPMMDETGLADLGADIKAHGLREHIKLWDGAIIDGRNRFEACKIAGVEPVFKALEFPGGEPQALAYVLSRNLNRRHLTVPQRALIAAKVATMRQGARTDLAQPSSRSEAEKLPEVSQAVAAQMLHVSDRSVRDAKVVLNSGDAELVGAVEAGRAPLHKAAEAVRRTGAPLEPEPWSAPPPVREPWRTPVPKEITYLDIVGWAAGATDSDLRKLADMAFKAITSVAERLKHDETVRAWLDRHEREERA